MQVKSFSRGIVVMATLLAVAASARVTHAQPQGSQGQEQEARRLFQAGRVAFEEGRYENALHYFERSYELSGKPVLLYNIGAAADRLRKNRKALESFKEYLEKVPDAPNRSEVQARIRVLEKVVSGQRSRDQVDRGPSVRNAGDRSNRGAGTEGGSTAGSPQDAAGTSPGGSGAASAQGSKGAGQDEQPAQPQTEEEPALEAGINALVNTGFFGRVGSSHDVDNSLGFAARFEIPARRLVAVGGFVRVLYWNLESTVGEEAAGANKLVESGLVIKGGYPIRFSGTLQLAPYAVAQVGWTVSMLSTVNQTKLDAGEDVAAGWNLTGVGGLELLVGASPAARVFAEVGLAIHNAGHERGIANQDLQFRTLAVNAGAGIAF